MKSHKRVKRSFRGHLRVREVKSRGYGVIGGTSDYLKVRDYPENRSAWASGHPWVTEVIGVSGSSEGCGGHEASKGDTQISMLRGQ